MTDNDPAQDDHRPLRRAAGQRLPLIDLRITTVDKTPYQGASKGLIQGVSGVAYDMTDIYLNQLEMYQTTGMLLDVTAAARRGERFGSEMTYPGIRGDFMIEEAKTENSAQHPKPRSRRVNPAAFARYGIPVAPAVELGSIRGAGTEVCDGGDSPGTRQRIFFLNRVWLPVLRRGRSLDVQRDHDALHPGRSAQRRGPAAPLSLTITERLMPTVAEQYSLVADATGFDSSFALFASGRFGMIYEGLWALIRLRPMADLRLRAVEPFGGGFPNTEVNWRRPGGDLRRFSAP